MKKAIPLILLLTIVVVVGIYVISKVKTKPKQQVVTQQFPSGEGVFPLLGTGSASVPNSVTPPLQTQNIPEIQVNKTQELPKGTEDITTVQQKENPTVKSCGVSALSFSITVPVSWRCNLEERNGNALVFYLDTKEIGSIEVFMNTAQSYDSLKQETQASLENSSIAEANMFATKVLTFQSVRYAKSVAFVHRNNTYYFRNSLIDQSNSFVFKLF